ncbi:MAG: altronate dehydratase family protein [Sneathiella sp.]
MVETQNCTILDRQDNVAIAMSAVEAGQAMGPDLAKAGEFIPAGHKVALCPIKAGERIIKYGQVIAEAIHDIAAGTHVHVHNAQMIDYDRDYVYGSELPNVDYVPAGQIPTFQGYARQNGTVGTRNFVGIVTTVNCSATVAKMAAEELSRETALSDFANVDGILPIIHGSGCGMASSGEAFDMLRRTLWGFASHPNFGGIVLVGLGCEALQISFIMEEYGLKEGDLLRCFTIQKEGGTRKAIDAVKGAVRDMLPIVNKVGRSTLPISELKLALQCGGSDGYSGITANPALGSASDLLVANGGTAILSETPEIYGAEHLLIRRAASRQIGEKLIERIRWWEDYTSKLGGELNNNPSPGNKKGGLTTILEKSLGAVAKGGRSPLMGVYEYGQTITTKGLNFMDSPGYDPCSITGQVASGANLICFTTGRGSVYGNKPVPSIKLATNSEMFNHMENDMDINCGVIVSEGKSVDEVGQKILDKIISVASGTRSKSELNGFGDCEFVPWNIGAVM